MPGKYRITKTVTTESTSLRTRIEIVEGEDGSFYGHTSLIDERGDLVERQQLAPDDLTSIVGALTNNKTKAIEDAGAVFVEGEAPEEAPNKNTLEKAKANK